jgi:hypothetical protein
MQSILLRLALIVTAVLPGTASSQVTSAVEPPQPVGSAVGRPLPNGNELVLSMIDRQLAFETALDRYTYDLLVTEEKLDQEGRVKQREVRCYAVVFVGGQRIRKLLEENGTPLAPDRQRREERRVRKEALRAVRRQEKRTAGQDQEAKVRISDVFKRFDFTAVERGTVDGREAVELEFRALPGERPIEHDNVLRALEGRFWIDEQQRAVRRVEYHTSEAIGFGAGRLASISHLEVARDFVPVDDIWLPRRCEVSLDGRVLLKGFRKRITEEYSNYRRFEVTTQEQVNPGAL